MTKLLTAATLGLAMIVTPAYSGPIAFDNSWKEQRFSLFSKNKYGFRGQQLDVASNGSVSIAYAAIPKSNWSARSASWSWAVSEGVPATDLRQKGGDDRNLALYAVFMPQADAEQLQNANIRDLLGAESARVLVYVWGGSHARGEVLDSPYLGARGKTVVLRASGKGSHMEKVDFARDYKRAFGGDAPALVGLAVSADSDDTKSKIRASISGLQLN